MSTSILDKLHRISLTLLCVGALGLLAGGCASPARVPLDPNAKNRIKASQGVVCMGQQEIAAAIETSNISQATGGGLIFALIDAGINNSRAKDAEQDVVPVRDALIGYDVGQTLKTDIENALKTAPWLNLKTVDIRQLKDEQALQSWLPTTEGNVVIFIRPFYRLTPNFSSISISAQVSIQGPVPAGSAGKPGAVFYSNTLGCMVPMPDGWPGDMPRIDAANLWAMNSGRKARKALDDGLSQIARLLAYDLEQPNPPEKKLFKVPEGTDTRELPGAQRNYQGYVTHSERTYNWVRFPFGELYAMP